MRMTVLSVTEPTPNKNFFNIQKRLKVLQNAVLSGVFLFWEIFLQDTGLILTGIYRYIRRCNKKI